MVQNFFTISSVTDQGNRAAETDYFSGDSISEISPWTIYSNPENCWNKKNPDVHWAYCREFGYWQQDKKFKQIQLKRRQKSGLLLLPVRSLTVFSELFIDNAEVKTPSWACMLSYLDGAFPNHCTKLLAQVPLARLGTTFRLLCL